VIQKIGLFGGTFDPPHLGHLIIAQSLAEQLAIARVIFIPSGNPPHKKNRPVTSGEHRMKMLRLALADNPQFEISDWELSQTAPTYTVNSVPHFQKIYEGSKLHWLIGADNLGDLPNWYEFKRLIDLVDIVTAYRGGIEINDILSGIKDHLDKPQFDKLQKNLIRTPMIEISAHDIRSRVKTGKSIRYLVPPAVEDYIRREGLYR